ncbi:MAG: glycerol kinase GlpK [Planctomycetes bacterium]|nr:glycerol kinase GlpK [Planctomycetota bacterium]
MFLALDQGTTSSRAIAFAADGQVLATAAFPFAQHFPAPGLVEHDPLEIAATQRRALVDAWQGAGGGPVRAVGITNQRETVLLWERATGRPLHRAIVWQDRRTAATLDRLRQRGDGPRIAELTGLPLDPYFSAAKIAWLLDHVPGARAAAERGEVVAGTIDSWLVFTLTGGRVFATEPSNASRTSLFDRHRGDWSDELCERFAVPRACLPALRCSADDFGATAEHGWPIRGVLGDQQAALFGHGCLVPGAAKCTYGTGAFLLANAGTSPPAPQHGLLGTVAWRLGDTTTHALEGSVPICGAAVQWLRDGLGILASSAEVESLARSVRDSGGVVFVPAFAGLGTPHWDADARGLMLGLTRGTQRAHIARATIEAMALQVDDVLAAMQQARGAALAELHVDGGAAANRLLLELQAALAGIPVVRPALLEATAFGAFAMALLGAGVVTEPARLPRLPGRPDVVAAAADLDVGLLRRQWQRAVERTRGWARA